jgi:hypothetical protein
MKARRWLRRLLGSDVEAGFFAVADAADPNDAGDAAALVGTEVNDGAAFEAGLGEAGAKAFEGDIEEFGFEFGFSGCGFANPHRASGGEARLAATVNHERASGAKVVPKEFIR